MFIANRENGWKMNIKLFHVIRGVVRVKRELCDQLSTLSTINGVWKFWLVYRIKSVVCIYEWLWEQ